jgi:ankyrin repeat protein
MLLQIEDSRKDIAASILRWVITALRPLTLKELAIATRIKYSRADSSDQVIQDHIGFCGSLLKINGTQVRLLHRSVKDYLLCDAPPKHFRVKRNEANLELARTCFEYIDYGAFWMRPSDVGDTELELDFPLLNYAALHWPEHARRAPDSVEGIFDLTGPFCQEKSPLHEKWWDYYRGHKVIDLQTADSPSLLHVASYFGILPLVRKLLVEKDWEAALRLRILLDNTDNEDLTPLWYAVSGGHEAVVLLLLQKGAKVNAKCRDGRTPLFEAVVRGNEEIVRLLLDKGADIEANSRGLQTPLHCAATSGNEEVVRLLLEKGANIKAVNRDLQTPLCSAAASGHRAVVQLLLEKGASIKELNGDLQTPLCSASANGHEAVVRLLLDKGADVDIKSWNLQTPLYCAAASGHEPVVQILLEHGANVNAENHLGQTPLYCAIANRNHAVVRLLREGGADEMVIGSYRFMSDR